VFNKLNILLYTGMKMKLQYLQDSVSELRSKESYYKPHAESFQK